MNEKPLRRLHYYNGQRLEAADFKEEQEYHIRTRRWLNKSLYSAGIARGLEVIKFPDGTSNVIVTSGLALDYQGREIILLEEIQLEVCTTSGTTQNSRNGNYLVVEYTEEVISYESGGCAMHSTESNASNSSSNWGGPTRVQSQVKFSWVRFVPPPETNQIVLAWVELDASCSKIVRIETEIRRHIGRASEALVRQYVLEGERVIANVRSMAQTETYISTTAKVYFHIRGRTPNSITLYLKASEFPKFHYTEMGYHGHNLDLSIDNLTIPPHQHDLPEFSTSGGLHAHAVTKIVADCDDAVWGFVPSVAVGGAVVATPNGNRAITLSPIIPKDGDPFDFSHHEYNLKDGPVEMKIELDNNQIAGSHTHTIPESPTHHTHNFPKTGPGISLQIQVNKNELHGAGIADDSVKHYSARSAKPPLEFFDDLQITIDGANRTAEIREQIINTVGGQAQAWGSKLGNGTSGHPLADESVEAVPIRLDYLSRPPSSEGQHMIEFSLPNSEANGGIIHYNLYIE